MTTFWTTRPRSGCPGARRYPSLSWSLQSVIVHTAETTCLHYFLDLLVANRHAGGRSRLRQDHHDQRQVLQARRGYSGHDHPFQQLHHFAHAPADHGETPGEEGRAQLRSKKTKGTKKLIYFIDGINMPAVDAYSTVQPHILIRQHLDYQHWYDRQKLTLKEIHNVQYVACA